MPRTNANAITTTKVLNITFRERELGQSRIFANPTRNMRENRKDSGRTDI